MDFLVRDFTTPHSTVAWCASYEKRFSNAWNTFFTLKNGPQVLHTCILRLHELSAPSHWAITQVTNAFFHGQESTEIPLQMCTVSWTTSNTVTGYITQLWSAILRAGIPVTQMKALIQPSLQSSIGLHRVRALSIYALVYLNCYLHYWLITCK